MDKKYSLLLLIFVQLLVSCSVSKRGPSGSGITPENSFAADYITKYKDIAVSEMKRTGVPASIKLAQGMLESDYGRSRLAVVANNHFGIKCHSNWNGPKVYHDDDAKGECFRKYSRAEDSFRDHSDFLRFTQRYNSLFTLRPDDYKGWAHGLKKAGYATNPHYANLLINKIEENKLYLFDSGNSSVRIGSGNQANSSTGSRRGDNVRADSRTNDSFIPTVNPRIMEKNRVQYILAKSGETFQSLAREFAMLGWEIEKYNEFEPDHQIVAGEIIYLQPKRKKAEVGFDTHIVKEGESLHYISQLYAIKLDRLKKYNGIDGSAPLTIGERLWLRYVRPDL